MKNWRGCWPYFLYRGSHGFSIFYSHQSNHEILAIVSNVNVKTGYGDDTFSTRSLGVIPIHSAERYMTKSTTTYWNTLSPENRELWTDIKGMEGMD